MSLKTKIKKIIPRPIISFYHFLLANFAALYYSFPSKKMVVIGITGTKGKTSTANFIWSVLTEAGHKTGLIGTVNIRIGDIEIPNKYHMTMPGRFILQGFLKKMADAKCEYCIVETTSEGIKQWRHYGIFYDVAIFTNLSPEHLESHGGSFENYKTAKGKLFASLIKNKNKKTVNGKRAEKVIAVNCDSPHKDYYLNFWADKKLTFGLSDKSDFCAREIRQTRNGTNFFVNGEKYYVNIFGNFNVYNALGAIAVCSVLGIGREKIKKGIANLKLIPGRMERIDEGQNFLVFIDYAHERNSMGAALRAARDLAAPRSRGGKVIVVFGAEGGGRDKAKRIDLGEVTAKNADIAIATSTDPYEDDPEEICETIAKTAEKFGKTRNRDLFVMPDRREAIKKALSLAGENDVVLIAGKGSEQAMIVGEKHIPWNDRNVVKKELNKLKSQK